VLLRLAGEPVNGLGFAALLLLVLLFVGLAIAGSPEAAEQPRAIEYRRRADIIRAGRIRKAPQHVPFGPSTFGFHGMDPAHCVCNGTHLSIACPRCMEVERDE
jgi:hypothetical protein